MACKYFILYILIIFDQAKLHLISLFFYFSSSISRKLFHTFLNILFRFEKSNTSKKEKVLKINHDVWFGPLFNLSYILINALFISEDYECKVVWNETHTSRQIQPKLYTVVIIHIIWLEEQFNKIHKRWQNLCSLYSGVYGWFIYILDGRSARGRKYSTSLVTNDIHCRSFSLVVAIFFIKPNFLFFSCS